MTLRMDMINTLVPVFLQLLSWSRGTSVSSASPLALNGTKDVWTHPTLSCVRI